MSESKKWVEVTLMPLVIAFIGIMGTYLITNEQRQSAEIRAEADRQIKILEIFANKILSPKEEERLLAVGMTMALDNELGFKMINAVDLENEESPKVKELIKILTSHAIISKLKASESETAGSDTLLDGRWMLRRLGEVETVQNWMEFEKGDTGLKVRGEGWGGEVSFDGKSGYFDWKSDRCEFGNNRDTCKTGRTHLYLDSTGILLGNARYFNGWKDYEWTYWGVRN